MLCDLLVHVDGSEGGRSRTRYAVSLAQKLDARLTGLHVTPPPELPPVYKPGALEFELAKQSDILAQDSRDAEEIFREETIDLKHTRWLSISDDIDKGVIKHAVYTDLAIIGQYEWQGSPTHHLLPIAAEIALRCGRPVLDLPEGIAIPRFARMIMTWDGSGEAVRAIHDAIPLARLFKSVDVLSISTDSNIMSHDDMIEHLKHHGISCGLLDEHTRADRSEIQIFDEFITSAQCDMLVMGAFSHSKWREYLFGGATQEALLKAKVPVLLSH
jgi:nucleotide-binding universal stress UspA family protein